jgi:Anti-sigma-K factor rskA
VSAFRPPPELPQLAALAEVQAPAALRARIDALRHAHQRRRRRFVRISAAAGAAAAAAAVTFALAGSTPSAQAFHVALRGTTLAQGARGDATLTKTPSGWRITLAAKGLPPRAGDEFYEAWLRNDAGVLVPVGTFNDGRTVTLWAGVSPLRFTALTVTRERADGNQESSGNKVLVGTVVASRSR